MCVRVCGCMHVDGQTDRQTDSMKHKNYWYARETSGRSMGRHLLSWVRWTTLFSISGIIRKGQTGYEFVTHKFLRVVLWKIWVFWKVMPCELTNRYTRFKWSQCLQLYGQAVHETIFLDCFTTIPQNVGNYLPANKMSYSRRWESTAVISSYPVHLKAERKPISKTNMNNRWSTHI